MRWCVGLPFADVRPGAGAFESRDRPHLHVIGRPRLQVPQRHAGGRRRQHAGLGVTGVGVRMGRPGIGRFALGDLLAVLDLVAADGDAGDRCGRGPLQVQRRVGRFAERRARHRRRGRLAGFEVRDGDGHVRGGRLALHGPLHLARVGALGLVVQRRALLDADLAGGGVDNECPGGRRLARQRVGQRIVGLIVAVVVGRPGYRVAHRRAYGGVLGDGSRFSLRARR